jgi:hypothetical protein
MTGADIAVALWVLAPLLAVHLLLWRRRELLRFQLVVDLLLLLLPGRILLTGRLVVPPVEAMALHYDAPVERSNLEQVDLSFSFIPWTEEARRLLRRGEPPWLSDRIGGGSPLFAATQSGFPFPLQAPMLALGGDHGTGVMVVWKLELAALGAFLFFRAARLVAPAAAVGALAYSFGLYSLSWVTLPLGWPHALLPFAWLGLGRSLAGSRGAMAGTAVLLGTLAGWGVNSEVGALVWLSLLPLVVVVARRRARRWRRAAAVLALGAAIAAVGAVPAAVTILDSAKYREGRDLHLYPSPEVTWQLRGTTLAHLAAPWRGGQPARGQIDLPFPVCAVSWSIGGAALALAVLGGVGSRRRSLRSALLATGLIATVLVLQLPLIGHVLARLPLLGSMTWARAGFLLAWSLAGLAALGLDGLERNRMRRRVLVVALIVQGLVLLARTTGTAPFTVSTLVAEGLIAPALLLAAWIVTTPRSRSLGVTAVVVAELMVIGWQVLPRSWPLDRSRPPSWLSALIAAHSGEPGRLLGAYRMFPEHLPALYGFADLRSNDPVRPLALARLHSALGATGMDLPGPVTTPWAGLAGAWGVRWLVTPAGGLNGPAAAGWQEAYADANARIYRNPRVLGEVRLAGAVIAPPGEPGTGSWEPIDFATTAVMERPVAVSGGGRLDVIERRPARTTVRVEARGTLLAILHAPRAPGWTATLDGRRVPLLEANLGAMAVTVPDGVHEVRWAYRPPGLVVGAVLTLAGLFACGMLAFAGRRRATRR